MVHQRFSGAHLFKQCEQEEASTARKGRKGNDTVYHFQAGGRAPDGAPEEGRKAGASGQIWPVGQAVKTSASHAGNGGSIPPRVTKRQ